MLQQLVYQVCAENLDQRNAAQLSPEDSFLLSHFCMAENAFGGAAERASVKLVTSLEHQLIVLLAGLSRSRCSLPGKRTGGGL